MFASLVLKNKLLIYHLKSFRSSNLALILSTYISLSSIISSMVAPLFTPIMSYFLLAFSSKSFALPRYMSYFSLPCKSIFSKSFFQSLFLCTIIEPDLCSSSVFYLCSLSQSIIFPSLFSLGFGFKGLSGQVTFLLVSELASPSCSELALL